MKLLRSFSESPLYVVILFLWIITFYVIMLSDEELKNIYMNFRENKF